MFKSSWTCGDRQAGGHTSWRALLEKAPHESLRLRNRGLRLEDRDPAAESIHAAAPVRTRFVWARIDPAEPGQNQTHGG